ncbi:MAG: hypothetical protein WBD40_05845 [Tepidisphaeraceae bacterium]
MTIDPAIIPPDDAKRDARCIRCGYDLRGHDPREHDGGGRCPECGLKAHWSLKAPVLLSQYPATWVLAMSRGVKLLAAAYLVMFVMLILAVGGALEKRDVLLFTTLLIAGLAQLAGAWMLSRSSRHWSEPPAATNRLLLRTAPVALLAGAIGALSLTVHFDPRISGATAIGFALSLIAPIAAFVRIRTVARMISDADLMEHSTVVGGGFLASVLAGAALYVFIGFRGDATGIGVTVALFGVIIALLMFLLWGAFLMFCCILDFGQAARIAMADWRADDAAVTPPRPGAGVQ